MVCFAFSLLSLGCHRAAEDSAGKRRVIVLGFDGMDYSLARELMSENRMPNFVRLAREGQFTPLETSIPPQSPVAWSDFVTGMDAGGHGIFDFIHRDPATMLPYLSTSRVLGPGKTLRIGPWQFPLIGGSVELLRRGVPFWEVLARNGVETTIIRVPANFPPSGAASRELSGMGTPDLLGTYGTFSFYTSRASAFEDKDVSGGRIYPVRVVDHAIRTQLHGPDNPFLVSPRELEIPLDVYLDPVDPVAKFVVANEEFVLATGEWSDWIPVRFDLFPPRKLHAMARFYLRQIDPVFELYVSPLNMDPEFPEMPISTPRGYAGELSRAAGRFYTQGMPEDTKALHDGVLSRQEFLVQARIAGDEVLKQYHVILDRFEAGLLFYYFGNLDQVSHMMWRPMDPDHPAYDPETDAEFSDVVKGIYEALDGVVGYTLDKMGSDVTLIVMSDHGFTSWRRAFSLNAWLRENGYLALSAPDLEAETGVFANVDWSRTRAYGLGLNGLYINLWGREQGGIVQPAERLPLMNEIAGRLLGAVDPWSGRPAITRVYQREDTYSDGGARDIGPDLVIGYARGTRCSNQSALGGVGGEIFMDNVDEWSGDHCMQHDIVPGLLLTNRHLKRPAANLRSLGASILAEFGIEGFPEAGRRAARSH